MSDQSANPERWIAEIASRQHGVVATAQLRAAGVDKHGITYRVRTSRLHRVHRGVYAVGHSNLAFEGRCLAAALACGASAAVSNTSAAAIWRLLAKSEGPVEVTVGSGNGRKPQVGIVVHRSATLRSEDVVRRTGVPVTTPSRTLRDIRRSAPRSLYLRAVRRALDLRLISRSEVDEHSAVTRSVLERRFMALCRRHRIPAPVVNAQVGGFEVDFLWIDHALIVETDGFRYHGNRAAFEADRARDAELQGLGYRVLRFTYRQVVDTPGEVIGRIRKVMRL